MAETKAEKAEAKKAAAERERLDKITVPGLKHTPEQAEAAPEPEPEPAK